MTATLLCRLLVLVSLTHVATAELKVITRIDPPPDDCTTVHCSWGAWSPWGPCDQPCGETGVQTRTRFAATRDSCGGLQCEGAGEETRECNRGCQNGGTPRLGQCHCKSEHWGQCCENNCTSITHCDSVTCTNATNHECRRCVYDRGFGLRAYIPTAKDKHRHRVCEKVCSWRKDSTYCYPGSCPHMTDSCVCAPGFTSHNCMTMTTAPSLVYCLVVAKTVTDRSTGSRTADSVAVQCDTEEVRMVYTSLDVSRLQIDFKSIFTGPSQTLYPKPSYIAAFRVGIVHAKVMYNVTRGPSLLDTSYVACSDDLSVDSPHQSLVSCTRAVDVNVSVQHGDVVNLVMCVEGGGYVKIANYDTVEPVTMPASYYRGRQTTRSIRFVVDREAPTHCTGSADCRQCMLDVGLPVTKTKTVNVSWDGWTDALSGIRGYQLQMSLLQIHDKDSLIYRSSPSDVKVELPANVHSSSLEFRQPGVYCVLLTVFDNAGNFQRARRFVIFDDTSSVTIKGHVGRTLAVEGSVTGLSGNWLTNVQYRSNDGASMQVSWRGHFANVFHQTRKILSRIQPHSPPLLPDYDDVDGQLPVTRSMEAIKHVDGVVKYDVAYSVNGQTVRLGEGSWIVNQSAAIAVPLQDGDVVRVSVRASDIMGNSEVDSIVVNVDTSPPVIASVGLVRGNVSGLRTHYSVELYGMRVKLQVFDLQSGIRYIEWEIKDDNDDHIAYGSGRVAVHVQDDQTNCFSPGCYCLPKDGRECYTRDYIIAPNRKQMKVPEGEASQTYHFVVTVMNNAMMETVYTYDFTIDSTPPQPGFVSDSASLVDDVDFQQSRRVSATWRGFIDRESGILFYRYTFGSHCFNYTDLERMTTSARTTRTDIASASHVTSGPGRCHCTVVAFNGAMTPSSPVCSDGVTVDVTPPEISAVTIKDAWTKDRLVKDNTGSVWYIDRNRNRCHVLNVTHDCRERFPTDNMIVLYPRRQRCDVDHDVVSRLCHFSYVGSPANVTVIALYYNLDVSWFGSDEESGLYDYEVGLSSDRVSALDISPFTSTHGQQRLILSQSLFDEGRTFYIHIKAINRAGIEAISVIGPCVMQTANPTPNISIKLGLKEREGEPYLVADWKGVRPNADESNTNYVSYGIGHSSGVVDVKEFESLNEAKHIPNICDTLEPASSCLAIPVRHLAFNLHDKHTYFLTLKTEGTTGLETAVVSRPYRHQLGDAKVHKRMIRSADVPSDPSAPVVHHVYDILLDMPGVDIDYSTNLNKLSTSWSFTAPMSDVISYTVSVGICPTCDDILSQQNNTHNTSIHLTNLSLTSGQRYYTSVTACNNRSLCTTAVSDGVIVDETPPVAGSLIDGFSGNDIDFQSSPTTLSVHWVNFYDLESGLSSMEWRAGTTPGSGNILAPTMLVVTNKASTILTQPLPLGETIYVTLKVVNKAGLWVERTTDGIQRDDSAPVEQVQVQLNGRRGTFNNYSQVWTESLSVVWNITDDESGISEQYISAMTEQSSHNSISAAKVYGDVTSHTFSGLSLADGDMYRVTVTACNKAGLCTNSTSQPILIDNTPPVVGDFVYSINDTVMTYENGAYSTINISWSGFIDPHCSIERYYVSAGTAHGATDLLMSPTVPVELAATSVDPQTVVLPLRATIFVDQLIHLTVWADNRAGLSSAHFHAAFKAVALTADSGILQKVTACLSPTCASQCTCTTDGQMLCRSTAACQDVSGNPSYGVVDVYDVVNYRDTGGAQTDDADITITQHSLAAIWRTETAPGVFPVKYEWTVGVEGESVGEGLLNANLEPVWREAGRENFGIYTTGSSRLAEVILEQQTQYVFYVRAWYDNVTYATSRSDGVIIDVSPPAVSPSVSVKEVMGTNNDVDFIESCTTVTVAWEGVFNGQSAVMEKYVVRLGTTLGNGDIAIAKVNGSVTRHTFEGLKLRDGEKYHSAVTALNDAGLTATDYSDGFTVDSTAPTPGSVNDGVGDSDVDFTGDSQHVSASWQGFKDDQSYVNNYVWCVGTALQFDDILACRNVGLRTHVTVTLNISVSSDTKLFSTVYAINGAGTQSSHAVSDGFIIDATPPVKSRSVRVQLNPQRTSLEADWSGSVVDPESPLVDFHWAIGTTTGGVQLQSFISVGRMTKAVAAGLPLDEVTVVQVTVVAKNAAGHRTVVISQPYFLNYSTPRVCCVGDGAGLEDADFQSTTNLTVRWRMTTHSGDTTSCEWAIGTTAGGDDVRPFTTTSSLAEDTVALGSALADGANVFSTIRCSNAAGTSATATSDGVSIVTTPPDMSNATLNIIIQSPTYYDSRDNHQAETSRLICSWNDVKDKSGIACVQVSVVDSQSHIVVPWNNIQSLDETFAELRGLNLQSYETYRIQLRVISNVGFTSDVINTNVTIESEAPTVSKGVRNRWLNSYTLLLDWAGSFTANSSLVYIVNVGSTAGSNDLVEWRETDDTDMTLTGVDSTQRLYVTLTAVNKAGLYTTRTFHV